MKALLVLTLSLSLVGSTALAQQPTHFDFIDGETVGGNLVRPEGEVITVPDGGIRPSLIRIRQTFVPEMLRAAEHL